MSGLPDKNPRRVAAGKRNREKSAGISAEGRLRLSEAAHRNRPWEASMRPKTEAGKLRSSRNAVAPKAVDTAKSRFLRSMQCYLRTVISARKAGTIDGAILDILSSCGLETELGVTINSHNRNRIAPLIEQLLTDD
ncbi:MAG: hypothetical protein U0892_16715 [Pirellulales bacterium]